MKIKPRGVWGHAVSHGWLRLLPVSLVYIHHSVTSAPPAKASEEVEAQHMRTLDGIAHGRGFQGFSYNYAVAKSGRAWTGRGRHVGAQNDGENSSSVGIVVMGNYQVDEATDTIVEGVGKLIAELKERGAIKRGVTIIRGHRDSDATACPGNKLYARLPDIRRKFKKEWRRMKREKANG